MASWWPCSLPGCPVALERSGPTLGDLFCTQPAPARSRASVCVRVRVRKPATRVHECLLCDFQSRRVRLHVRGRVGGAYWCAREHDARRLCWLGRDRTCWASTQIEWRPGAQWAGLGQVPTCQGDPILYRETSQVSHALHAFQAEILHCDCPYLGAILVEV